MRSYLRFMLLLTVLFPTLAAGGLLLGAAPAATASQQMDMPAGHQAPGATTEISVTVWMTEVIDSQAELFLESSAFQVDTDDVPSLAYVSSPSDGAARTLRYARREGQTWTFEQVGTSGYTGSAPSLALDALNQPHLSYLLSGTIYHAQRLGGSWQIDPVETGKAPIYDAALAVSDAGTVGIALITAAASSDILYYAESTGGAWTVTEVAVSVPWSALMGSAFDMNVAIDFDSLDQPHISYVNLAYGPRDSRSLQHATRISSGWVTRTVGAESYIPAHRLRMVDAQGGYVAYSLFGPHCVIPCPMSTRILVKRIGVDGAVGETMLHLGGGTGSTLGLDAYAGYPHLVYDSVYTIPGSSPPTTVTTLDHMRLSPLDATWDLIAVGDLSTAALAISRRGEPMAVYYDTQANELMLTQRRTVTFTHGTFLPGVMLDAVPFEEWVPDQQRSARAVAHPPGAWRLTWRAR